VVDKDFVIIKGHCRWKCAKQLKLKSVPVVVRDDLTPEQCNAARLADNKLSELAEVDMEAIQAELDALKEINFDLDLTAFDSWNPFAVDAAEGTEGMTDPDDVPELKPDPKSKLGDVWLLGNHRVMCGDSTDAASVAILMNGQKADMVFTDPPYNHASDDKGVAASVRKAHKNLMKSEWDKNFDIRGALSIIDLFKSENSSVYICTSWHLAGSIWEWSAKHSNHHSYCVWHKPNPMPSLMKRHWTWASELICYATFGKHTFNFPEQGHASSVWSFTKVAKCDLHPTMKPVAVPEHAITHSSKSGHLVLDLFLGSGTTLIACEKTGRHCYGMELSPQYVDVILKRWQDFTGKKAVREDGIEFDSL
jgi:site-specific DNA-methyltransferase (adenine-specific)